MRVSKQFCLLALPLLMAASGSQAQDAPLANLDACSNGAFSTEEDFMMGRGEPFDGNPYVSDGDILSTSGEVCARNRELVSAYDVTQDLGLDALDILSIEERMVAFSTELDSPHGNFEAGDLLITSAAGLRAVVPNSALVAAFDIRNDVGLDEAKFIGPPDGIRRFAEAASQIPLEGWQNGRLQLMLEEFQLELWFSIEGTAFDRENPILDGDILSATGSIVVSNRGLLAPPAPAGLPSEGVDFGLDGFATSRGELDREQRIAEMLFSTEINYGNETPFTDGDILRVGGSIVAANDALVSAFAPKADFLGLDALWVDFRSPADPVIQVLCDRPAVDFDGGITLVGGSGTGLYQEPLTSPPALEDTLGRPCGRHVPIDGFLPAPPTDVDRFRVVYREVSEPVPGTAGDPATPAIQTAWQLKRPTFEFIPGLGFWRVCKTSTSTSLATDPNGWIDAQEYYDAKNGTGSYLGCPNPELRLAVWNTQALPAGTADGDPVPGVRDREDHYVVWLEWEDTGGTMHRESADHHLQLDNTLPVIASHPDGLQIRLADGTVVQACGETPAGTADLQVWGQFHDRYYENFAISLKGGIPPASTSYGPHHYYDPTDGTSGVKNTDGTGTAPDGTTVHLRDITLNDLGESFKECCYYLELRVFDRAIRHSFNGKIVNDVTGSVWSETFMTFSASP